jgi:ABC-2 type transport system ATP-binding protein
LYHVPKRDRAERIEDLLDRFNLKEKRNARFGGLSKGLKRRAVIAAAMVHQPEVLFLDEPTAGLDVMSAISLREFIKDLRRKETTVFLTTHYIEEADQLCDRIAVIVKGRIVTVETPEKIKSTVEALPVVKARFSDEPGSKFLGHLTEIGSVDSDEREISIEVENVDGALKDLIRISLENGMHIEEVNTVRPSLEDAFVKLTGVSPETMKYEKETRGG